MYTISSNGFRETISFDDDGRGRIIAIIGGIDAPTWRDVIKADIRRHPDRNGAPCQYVSDHGNVWPVRRVTLRRL